MGEGEVPASDPRLYRSFCCRKKHRSWAAALSLD